ncbi:C-C motif chemokine 4-like [Chiroxiphia lanceolata]|uniref:C-C motif chemokine 4-like n=1 Tax=Chiroxiphia lanceolata TaxID=296741 RepID=UPI0008464E9E|nr:C-C motif chemokine 4-like isoform X2 [Manacus vitellinus]XP_032563621.1 C-C motif chemokine 4-like [Chiroxiphia lanceolata]XP_051665874.1 C-C motif chemokine 4-like [Manacus candei]
MKICSLALLTLLLAAPWTGSQGMSLRTSHAMCCHKGMFIRREIPASKIKSYQNTPSLCSRKAVILKLQKGTVCVDPEVSWFQKYLKEKKLINTSM